MVVSKMSLKVGHVVFIIRISKIYLLKQVSWVTRSFLNGGNFFLVVIQFGIGLDFGLCACYRYVIVKLESNLQILFNRSKY